jgi:hypothetical protein
MNPKTSTAARDLAESVARFLVTFEADRVPLGWYSLQSFSKATGCHIRTAERVVKKFERVKHAERKYFKVPMANHLRSIPHYRFSPQAAKALGLTKPRR